MITDIKSHSPTNGFHKIMWITDALKENVHELNEQTITIHIAVYIRIVVDIKSDSLLMGFTKSCGLLMC